MNKVMIIGGNPLELLGLRTLLKSGFKVAVEMAEPPTALKKLREFHPDVVLLDTQFNGYDITQFSGKVKKESPETKVMWLLSDKDDKAELAALRCSIDGCVLKAEINHLPQALKLVQEEEVYFPSFFLKKWFRRTVSLVDGTSNNVEAHLSEREKEIIELVKSGKTNQEIAEELYVSVETIKTHLKNIRRKLHLRKSRQLSYNPHPSLESSEP